MMSDRAWPTAAELDAKPDLWSRWWWVNGTPERLGVDRMTHPARVTWRARFVDELPVEWFDGMVMTADECAAVEEKNARMAEALRDLDGEIFTPERPLTIAQLRARVAELEAPGECASIHKLQAKLSEVTAERDRMWLAVDQLRNFGESSGDAVERIVSELFEAHTLASGRLGERAVDAVARLAKDRTAGYERATAAEAERDELSARVKELDARIHRSGNDDASLVIAARYYLEPLAADPSSDIEDLAIEASRLVVELRTQVKEVTAERDRYKTGCEHYLERAETVRHLMAVGEDVVGTLHRIAGEYVQVSFSRWRWRRMTTDGVPHDTERVLQREWLVSDDRAILVAAFGADVVAKVEAP